jgi:hypothetical protein
MYNLTDWANFSQISTAMFAGVALVFGVWQIRQNRLQQLESLARDNYQEFMRTCIAYPEFVAPMNEAADVSKGTFDGDIKKFAQYEWFVTSALNALEAIYCTVGAQLDWQCAIQSILDEHVPYLLSSRFAPEGKTYDPAFLNFVQSYLVGKARVQSGSIAYMAAE